VEFEHFYQASAYMELLSGINVFRRILRLNLVKCRDKFLQFQCSHYHSFTFQFQKKISFTFVIQLATADNISNRPLVLTQSVIYFYTHPFPYIF
jgi:hypothetical protein